MIICETIDSSDCDTIPKIVKILSSLKHDGELNIGKLQVLQLPNPLFDLCPHLEEFLELEKHLTTRDLSNYQQALRQLKAYQREACYIYALIDKYLDTRSRDNYKEILYRDSLQLIQLRQQKVFLIQLLILQQLVEELEFSESLTILLECLSKHIELTAQVHFASLRPRVREIVTKALALLEELKDVNKLDNKLLTLERQSSKKSMMSSLRKLSYQFQEHSNMYSSTLKWLLQELQNNQILCRELIPNLRFIIKNFGKQLSSPDHKRMTRTSFIDFKSRIPIGSQRFRAGLIELPSIGPYDSIPGASLSKNSISQYLDEEDLKNAELATIQIDSFLTNELLAQLTGESFSFESKANQFSESSYSYLSLQSHFKTFRPEDE